MYNRSFSLVAPAYNEGENIEKFIEEANTALNSLFNDYEIIIVNDGSSDNTQEILERISKKFNRLSIVKNSRNKGYGEALRKGIEKSSKELLFFTDSDLQFDLKEISSLIKEFKEKTVVIGYREKRRDNFLRRFNARIWNLIIKSYANFQVRDVNCAFKLFPRTIFHDINLFSTGALINAEILKKVKEKGYKIKEVKVSHFPREKGRQTGAKLGTIFRAIKELATLKKEFLFKETQH